VTRKYLDQIRRNAGPFTDPDATNEEFLAQFEKFKIL
jgi:ubiquitin-activating enzyme E1 C